ncbi:hypothetical protein MTO96_026802 [Rhipicephalus appendiculatus]
MKYRLFSSGWSKRAQAVLHSALWLSWSSTGMRREGDRSTAPAGVTYSNCGCPPAKADRKTSRHCHYAMKYGAALAFAASALVLSMVFTFFSDHVAAETIVTTICYLLRDNENCTQYVHDGKSCHDLRCEDRGMICCLRNCNTTHFCYRESG